MQHFYFYFFDFYFWFDMEGGSKNKLIWMIWVI